ncbi:hypothetical protein Nepgr_022863 [Nepenthes gracilis]|uniref:Uncharacterized protein n=1 Tax=Nepenthes gracilis TaxID=150966 RepID=A0AAD3T3C2_NEPGR|nr:hypothetical protein Nepgr_022863 [Nepenthes gracilis]
MCFYRPDYLVVALLVCCGGHRCNIPWAPPGLRSVVTKVLAGLKNCLRRLLAFFATIPISEEVLAVAAALDVCLLDSPAVDDADELWILLSGLLAGAGFWDTASEGFCPRRCWPELRVVFVVDGHEMIWVC